MKNKSGSGYTIVELLIVLAISGVTGVFAFTLVRGQQAKNQFQQSVRDFETKLLDIANDVSKGYYPNPGATTCVAAANAPITFTNGNVEQGASNDCIFAGKIIQFNPFGTDEEFHVHTLASRRVARDGKDITQLSQLESGDLQITPGMSLSETFNMLYGLRIRSVSGNGTNIGSIAFMSGFANQTAGGSLTGAPETEPRWIQSSTLNQTRAEIGALAVNPDNYRLGPEDLPAETTILICLEFGVNGQRASLELGQNGRALTATTRLALSDNAAENDAICP